MICIAAVLFASVGESVSNARQLGVGTMGTANCSIATAIAQTIETATDYSAVVQPAPATSAFLPLLHTGDWTLRS